MRKKTGAKTTFSWQDYVLFRTLFCRDANGKFRGEMYDEELGERVTAYLGATNEQCS